MAEWDDDVVGDSNQLPDHIMNAIRQSKGFLVSVIPAVSRMGDIGGGILRGRPTRATAVADPHVSQTAVCDRRVRAPSGERRRVSYPMSDSIYCIRPGTGEKGERFGCSATDSIRPQAHKVDSSTKERWLGARRLDPDEEYANQWAVRTLVSEEAWDAAEQKHSTDLHQVVAGLRLPVPAGVAWERWRRDSFVSESIVVRLSACAREILERPITGRGGHQSFFSRLRPRGRTLEVGYREFSFARERASVVRGGGWLAIGPSWMRWLRWWMPLAQPVRCST